MATKDALRSLNDIKTEFVRRIGNEPKTVQQMLSFCQQNGFGFRYKEIKQWWNDANTLKVDYNTDENRDLWKLDSYLMAFSRSKNEWFPCKIEQCIDDKWIVIKYNKTTKKIERNSKHIKPFARNHPLLFKQGTRCKIYCNKIRKWCDAQIINIFNDDEGEWLRAKYHQNGVQKTCEIQRFSKDLIANHDLDGIWNENICSLESCNVDNIIYIFRNYIVTKQQFQTKKFAKYTEKIVAYFYRNRIDGQRMKQLNDKQFAEQLLCELNIKNSKKLRNAFMKIFNLFAIEISAIATKNVVDTQFNDDDIKQDIDDEIKEESVPKSNTGTHHFSQKSFFVSFH